MFSLNNFWEKFFFLMTYFCQGPGFLNPKAYSILHQRHHYYSDTPKDPHSPLFSKNITSMMFNTFKKYQQTKKISNKDLEVFIHKDFPTWPKFEKFVSRKYIKFLWGFVYFLIYLSINPPLWMYLFIPFHFMVGPLQGAIVNWFGHKSGYRNYYLDDQSTNAFPFDIFLMGELYQNNHHKDPQHINFSVRWFEFDPTYFLIIFLKYLKIIQRIH